MSLAFPDTDIEIQKDRLIEQSYKDYYEKRIATLEKTIEELYDCIDSMRGDG
jgi:hypothetical protein